MLQSPIMSFGIDFAAREKLHGNAQKIAVQDVSILSDVLRKGIAIQKPQSLNRTEENIFKCNIEGQFSKIEKSVGELLSSLDLDFVPLDDKMRSLIEQCSKLRGKLQAQTTQISQTFSEYLVQNLYYAHFVLQLSIFLRMQLHILSDKPEELSTFIQELCISKKCMLNVSNGHKYVQQTITLPSLKEIFKDIGRLDHEKLALVLQENQFLGASFSSEEAVGHLVSTAQKFEAFMMDFVDVIHRQFDNKTCDAAKIIKIYRELLDKSFLSSDELLKIAEELSIIGVRSQKAEAINQSNKALDKILSLEHIDRLQILKALIGKAQNHYLYGETEEIIELLKDVDDLDSSGLFLLSCAYHKQGKYPEARTLVAKINFQELVLEPEGIFFKKIFEYCNHFSCVGYTALDDQQLLDTVKFDKTADNYFMIGLQYLRSMEYTEMIEHFDEALECVIKNKPSTSMLLYKDSPAVITILNQAIHRQELDLINKIFQMFPGLDIASDKFGIGAPLEYAILSGSYESLDIVFQQIAQNKFSADILQTKCVDGSNTYLELLLLNASVIEIDNLDKIVKKFPNIFPQNFVVEHSILDQLSCIYDREVLQDLMGTLHVNNDYISYLGSLYQTEGDMQ